MTSAESGWNWFEAPRLPSADVRLAEAMDDGLANAAARCFGSADGQRVLQHLRALTLERTLGPAVSDAMLRHIEGQRSLVTYLVKLTARGLGCDVSDVSSRPTRQPGPEAC